MLRLCYSRSLAQCGEIATSPRELDGDIAHSPAATVRSKRRRSRPARDRMVVPVSPTGVTIRAYRETDLDEVLDAWYTASVVAHSFLPTEFFPAERERVATQWLPMAETHVAEIDGHVVGFVALVGNEVGAIFLRPDHHGRGIGRALMDHARARRPMLELDVFERNEVGRRFYDAYGFEFVSAHPDPLTGETQHRLRLAPERDDGPS